MATAPSRIDLVTSSQRGPSSFLYLAPTTSASYPVKNPVPAATTTSSSASSIVSPAQTPGSAELVAVPLALPVADASVAIDVKTRRSSSLSSEGSNAVQQRKRFLKLGPVHFGEGTGDWSEDVVAE